MPANLNNFFLKNVLTFASEMQIMYELQNACDCKTDAVSCMVQVCIKDNKPAALLIKTLREMAATNKYSIADIIGEKLTTKILSL